MKGRASPPLPSAAHARARDLLTATLGRGHGDDYAAMIEAPRASPTGGCSDCPQKNSLFAGDLGFPLRFRIFNGLRHSTASDDAKSRQGLYQDVP